MSAPINDDPEKTREIEAQGEQLRALIAKRGPACPETRRRAAAILSATLAGGVAAPPPAPPPRPPAPPPATRGVVALLVAGLLALVVGVGCVPVEAVEQARTEASINAGHARDESLPIEARQVGADNERAWQAQHRALTGDPVPGSEAWPPLPPELAPAEAR